MSNYTIDVNGYAHTVLCDIDFTKSFSVEDLTDRIESLREELDDLASEGLDDYDEFCEGLLPDDNGWSELCELRALEEVLDELEGDGSSYNWKEKWYPQEAIHEKDFEKRMDDMVENCYDFGKTLPSWVSFTVDYEALKRDYKTHSFEDNLFFVR